MAMGDEYLTLEQAAEGCPHTDSEIEQRNPCPCGIEWDRRDDQRVAVRLEFPIPALNPNPPRH